MEPCEAGLDSLLQAFAGVPGVRPGMPQVRHQGAYRARNHVRKPQHAEGIHACRLLEAHNSGKGRVAFSPGCDWCILLIFMCDLDWCLMLLLLRLRSLSLWLSCLRPEWLGRTEANDRVVQDSAARGPSGAG